MATRLSPRLTTTIVAGALLVALLLLHSAHVGDARAIYDLILQSPLEKRQCAIYANEPMHAMLDKLCGDCAEIFGHEIADLHSKCRAHCFENQIFQMCWQAISPSGGDS